MDNEKKGYMIGSLGKENACMKEWVNEWGKESLISS